MTPVQYTLHIDVVGISLWVKRADCIDVLFPKDLYPPASDRHHTVTLHVNSGVSAPMDGKVIDLRGLGKRAMDNDIPIFAGSGWVEEPLSAAAPARNVDAVFDTTSCIAALRLPFGIISPIPNRDGAVGPCIYGKYNSLFFSYGMRWSRTYTGDPEVHAAFVDQQDHSSADRWLGGASTPKRSFTLELRCLSEWDRTHVNETINPNDLITDYTMLGVLTQDNGRALNEAPQYVGGEIQPKWLELSKMRTNPRKPCPPAWADPAT